MLIHWVRGQNGGGRFKGLVGAQREWHGGQVAKVVMPLKFY